MTAEVVMGAAMLRELFRHPGLDDFPGPFAERARRAAADLRRLWERTARHAAGTRTVRDLHAARDEYHDLLAGYIRLLKEHRHLAELHQRAFGPGPGRLDELDRALADLGGLYDELFPRWRTADDLHQLLIEKFSLPADRLRELAARHPPPPSWGEETDDPFAGG